MYSKKYIHKMLITSYVFSLVVFATVLVLGSFSYVFIGWYNDIYKLGKDTLSNGLAVASFFCLLLFGLFISFIMESYDMFGKLFIYEDELKVKAPFRKTIRIRFEEIRYIQIDYQVTSYKQFWVILSQEPIPDQFRHRVLKVRFTNKAVRIPYCKKVDQALSSILIGDLYKQYNKSKSTLRAHNISE